MTEQELTEQAIGLGYVEPVDYSASQETDSFGTKVKKAEKGEIDPKDEEEHVLDQKGKRIATSQSWPRRGQPRRTTMVSHPILGFSLNLAVFFKKLLRE